jgi:hypothetical protein
MTRVAPHATALIAFLIVAAITLGLAGCTGIKLPDQKPAPNWPMND